MSGPSNRKGDPDDPSGYAPKPSARDQGASGQPWRRARMLDAKEPVGLDAGRPAKVPSLDAAPTIDGVRVPRPPKPTMRMLLNAKGPVGLGAGRLAQAPSLDAGSTIGGVRVPLSLEPAVLPQRWTPPRRRVSFGMIGGFACVMAAAFVVGRQLAMQESGSSRSPVAQPNRVVAPQPAVPAVIERTMSIPFDDRQVDVPPQQQPMRFEWAAPRTVPEPAAAGRQLDADEIASLLKRGEQFVAKGDLAAARSLFERSAEAGDARAAFALAETYDPLALLRRGEQGFASDIALARSWYERAREFGSREASQRLQMLASQDK